MRTRFLITTLLAVGTFVGLAFYLQRVPRAADQVEVARTWVVAANRDLGVGQVLSAEDLTLSHLPVEDLPGRTLTCTDPDGPDCADVRGRLVDQTLGAARFTGEPITPDMLGPRVVLEPHERAIAIPLDSVSGLAGLIAPGMEVAVMAVITDADSPTGDTVAKVLFDKVRVVWLSPQFRTRAAAPLEEQEGGGRGLAVVALSMEPDAIVYDRQSTLFARALDNLSEEQKAEQGIDEAFIDSLREAPDVLWGVPLEMMAALAHGNFQLVMLPQYPADLTTPGFSSYHLQIPIWDLLSEQSARIKGGAGDGEDLP